MRKKDIFKYAFLIGAGYTAGAIVTKALALALHKTGTKVRSDLDIEFDDDPVLDMSGWSDEDKYCGRQMCYMHRAAKEKAEAEKTEDAACDESEANNPA